MRALSCVQIPARAAVTPDPHLAPATAVRSGVFLVVVATMVAQVASIMGVAVFPIIAPQLAAVYGLVGSYALTFGLPAVIAASGYALLLTRVRSV